VHREVKLAFVCEAPKTGVLRKVCFRTGSVVTGDTLKVSFQDVDPATGDPNGTADQFRTEEALMDEPTVSYHAVSVLKSRTMWLNVATFIAALSQTVEFTRVIPVGVVPYWLAATAAINVWLRMSTVRPVAMIGPSDTRAVEVPKVGPPPPKVQG
jgi:hypothetical protein